MSRKLREKERRLLEVLQRFEQDGRVFELAAIAQATGYAIASVNTYFSKRLEHALAERTPTGHWRARGALKYSEDDFARLMSQKVSEGDVRTEAEWRAAMLRLIAVGKQRGFAL